jgi:hypothetical protein
MVKMQLRMLKAADFQELVDAAITMEGVSSKFKRNIGRKPSWSPGSIQATNQLQIFVSNLDHQVGVRYPGEEDETLEVEDC